MSCVWIGLITALKLNESPLQFVQNLQRNNVYTDNVWWNGERLSEQAMKENTERISAITTRDVTDGYDVSGCEPVLLLVCQIYGVNILHTYNDHKISYVREYPDTKECSNKTLKLCADRGHFWSC